MNKKQVIGLGLVAVAASMGAGAVINQMVAEPVVVTKEVVVEKIVTKEVPVQVVTEVVKEVEVEKLVNVTVEDKTFKVLACDRLFYEDLNECVEEVSAEDKALKIAVDYIKAEYADELENADLVEDERDAKLIKVYDSFEDLTVESSDFDDNEYEFVIKVKVNDEEAEEKFYANFTVEVKDNEAEVVDVELV